MRSTDWTGEWTCISLPLPQIVQQTAILGRVVRKTAHLGLFRTIVNGSILWFHSLLEVCAVFMPISILIEAPCTFLTPKNSMKKNSGASNFQTLPKFVSYLENFFHTFIQQFHTTIS